MSTPTSTPSSTRLRDLAGKVGFVPGGLLLVLSGELGRLLPDRLDLPVPLLLGVSPGSVEHSSAAAGVGAFVGILSGMVLAEHWMRQRVRP